MRLAPTFTALAMSAVLASLSMQIAAESTVAINFKQPEKFRDASLRGYGYARGADDFVLNELRACFERLGERYLAPGQNLHIEVRDVDLAGRYEPWQTNAYTVRFMRDITWPSIKLHYVLQQNGRTIDSGDARVSDPFYLQRPGRFGNSDRLYAEKAMLGDWFRKQFAEQRVSGLR